MDRPDLAARRDRAVDVGGEVIWALLAILGIPIWLIVGGSGSNRECSASSSVRRVRASGPGAPPTGG